MGKDFASFHIIKTDKKKALSLVYPSLEAPKLDGNLSENDIVRLSFLKSVLGENFINEYKKDSYELIKLSQPLFKTGDGSVSCSQKSKTGDGSVSCSQKSGLTQGTNATIRGRFCD